MFDPTKPSNPGGSVPSEAPYTHGDAIGTVPEGIHGTVPPTRAQQLINDLVDTNDMSDMRIFDKKKELGLPEDATVEEMLAVMDAREAAEAAKSQSPDTIVPEPISDSVEALDEVATNSAVPDTISEKTE